MLETLSRLSLSSLFDKLQTSLMLFVGKIEKVAEEQNKSISLDEIKELRNHISSRLSNNEEIEDNKKILKLLELFSTDKEILEVLREDASNWLRLLDAIEANLVRKSDALSEEEKQEIIQIHDLAGSVRELTRR